MLDFTARVEFDTNFNAEVYVLYAAGAETLIADDSKMAYHPRNWYSGTNTVKTEPIAPIPEGTVKLKVKFSVETNPQLGYGKCFGSFCKVKMFKITNTSAAKSAWRGCYNTLSCQDICRIQDKWRKAV